MSVSFVVKKTAAFAAVLCCVSCSIYLGLDSDTVACFVANPTFPAKSVEVAPNVNTVSYGNVTPVSNLYAFS